MSQTSSSTSEQHEPRPPPYSPPYYGEYSHSGVTHQVGNGNIAVVSPPGPYPNTTLPDGTVEFGEDSQVGPTQTPFVFESASDDGGFSDAVIRKGFVRKVYLTLMIQLLFTVGIICAFLYWNTLRSWVLRTSWFSYTMMSVVLVLAIFMSCCGSVRRRVPLNFIALGLFTLAEGLMLGSVAAYFDAEVVLWAVGATAFVSFSMSLFAMQSKFLYIFYSFLGTVLFSLYLLFDTQLILGGKYEISPEEYVFATLNLYVDIITLFIFLLQLLNLCNS
ncbi:transcript variant X2 [Nothobranchius furzeri]|uniref:Transcript variant X2 n=1 Tax=Nothobranchius furzeri TaxID=105023 RepID=A0A9D3BX83_NOTFU|nr:protein lifeguard 1 isoform X2 [Nothobranchius furzeri]KAF7226117.1 transcript variant X2 [Nothobranchius furzeri]